MGARGAAMASFGFGTQSLLGQISCGIGALLTEQEPEPDEAHLSSERAASSPPASPDDARAPQEIDLPVTFARRAA